MSLFDRKSKALVAFDKIGKSNGSVAPESTENRAAIAYEFYIADALAAAASKRKEAAKLAAANAGIVIDDTIPGETKLVYENEYMTINARTAQPASRVDMTKLRSELTKKLGAVDAEVIIKKATTNSKPATTYIFASK